MVVKWFLSESDSAAANTVFHESDALLAPAHALGEIGEVLLRAYRRGFIGLDDVRRANDVVTTRIVLCSPSGLIDRATTIAVDGAVSFYDALYVAAAETWALELVTADARLVAKLASTPWGRRIRLLST